MRLPTKATVTRPLAHGYDALLEHGATDADSLYLRLATAPSRELRLVTVDPDSVGRAPDLASSPEDMRPETGTSYSRSDFTGGEGLDRAHDRASTERDWSRFWDSRNVDISPAKGGAASEIKLLHETASLRSADADNLRGSLVRLGSSLFGILSAQNRVDRSDNPTATTPSWTVENPGGTGDVADIAALGNQLYAAQDTIRQRATNGTWSSWSALDSDRLWSVKGRIVAAVGTALYEARASSGSLLLHTLAPGETWNDVADAGPAVLAAASDGYLYSFAEEDGELVLRRQTLIEGEQPTALGVAHGLIFVGTGQPTTAGGKIGRLIRAAFVGLQLRDAQVVRTWGDGSTSLDLSPKRIISDRESVWTAVPDSTETHLWRYHLETAGLVRDLIVGAAGQAQGLCVIDDRMFISLKGSALYREATTYAATGYVIGPLADFFNAAPKTWVGARLTTGSVPTGTEVTLDYATIPGAIETPASNWTTIITATPSAPGDSVEEPITGVQSRYLAGKVTLEANTAKTSTPTVLAFAFRALPIPTEEDFSIPVNVSDRIEAPHRKPVTVKNLGKEVYEALVDLKGRNITLTLLRSGEKLVGQLRSIGTPIYGQPERGSVTVYSLVTIRGTRTE